MNLVVGATGLLGSEICRLLSTAGKPVRALIRSTSDKTKVEKLKSLAVSFTLGDLKDRSSLDTACRGVANVISTANSTMSRQEGDSIRTVDFEGQVSLVDAAKSAGVRHFTFISFRDNPDIQFPLTVAKRKVEQRLEESGMNYTSLQASWFMEFWLSPELGFDFVNTKARILGAGHNKISWVSFQDVAKFAVASVDNPAVHKGIVEIGGPQSLSPLEVVKIFEKISGKPYSVEHVPEEALQAQKDNAPDPLQESIAGLMLRTVYGDEIDMQETLRAFPIQLTTVESYTGRVLSNS